MTEQSVRAEPNELEVKWAEVENKHSLRCLWGVLTPSRTINVECMWFPRVGITIMVCKHYDKPLPRSSSRNKPWPKLTALYAYMPEGGTTWDSLDKMLSDLQVDKAA